MAPVSDLIQPCRPYQPGNHARWLRGRLNRSMLIAAVLGGILAAIAAVPIGVLTLSLSGLPATSRDGPPSWSSPSFSS